MVKNYEYLRRPLSLLQPSNIPPSNIPHEFPDISRTAFMDDIYLDTLEHEQHVRNCPQAPKGTSVYKETKYLGPII